MPNRSSIGTAISEPINGSTSYATDRVPAETVPPELSRPLPPEQRGLISREEIEGRTDATPAPTVLLLHLQLAPTAVKLLGTRPKALEHRPSKAVGDGRYAILDALGRPLHQACLDLPRLCLDPACGEEAPAHERGCWRLPHQASLYLKIPDLPGASKVAFFRAEAGKEIALGAVDLP